MLRCEDCEYFDRDSQGKPQLHCDPFSTIKEPQCLAKWQFFKLDSLTRSYEAMLEVYRRMAPLQERMFQHMERELDDADEADQWKLGYDEDNENDEEE